MQSWVQSSESIVLKHVKERRLSGIVESKKENLGILVHQAFILGIFNKAFHYSQQLQHTKIAQGVPEPVDNKHLFRSLFCFVFERERWPFALQVFKYQMVTSSSTIELEIYGNLERQKISKRHHKMAIISSKTRAHFVQNYIPY